MNIGDKIFDVCVRAADTREVGERLKRSLKSLTGDDVGFYEVPGSYAEGVVAGVLLALLVALVVMVVSVVTIDLLPAATLPLWRIPAVSAFLLLSFIGALLALNLWGPVVVRLLKKDRG